MPSSSDRAIHGAMSRRIKTHEPPRSAVLSGLEAPNPEREVFYARVSTEDQSLDRQLDMARKRGIPERNWYKDVGSAAGKRPAFQLMLKFICQRAGWKIVTERLDRLGRDTKRLIELIEHLDKEGVGLVSLTEQFDTKTPMGRMIFTLKAAFAQMERELIRERTRSGLAALKERGVRLGRESRLNRAQFVAIEKALLDTAEPITKIGKRYKVHPTTINYHFPRWRTKTKREREAHRKQRPLPQGEDVAGMRA